jgi:guanosine-3',5'-bis(diphosphate) 3'-pyrophosphohydrolase
MSELLIKALQFAADKHRYQMRKDEKTPYINHPIAVAHILAVEAGIDDEVLLAAALLHDTIEDTETTAEEMTSIFGQEITALVLEATDVQDVPREMRYATQLKKASHYSGRVKLLKLADKIANMRDATHTPPALWTNERRRIHFDQSLKVVDILRGTHEKLEALFDQAYADAIASIPKSA